MMRALSGRGAAAACLLLMLVTSAAAQPAPADPAALRAELDRLRTEFESLRQQYAERLRVIEERLDGIERAAAAAPAGAAPVAEAQVPPGAAGAGGPTGALPVYGNVTALSKIFNPDIAVIGNVLGAAGSNGVDPSPAVVLEEAEASLQAVVDPYARADFFFAFGPEGVDVEEGYLTFPTVPGGLLVKAGKLRASFGKVNTFHRHQLPWVDRPLVTENLVGGEEGVSDSGVSVSRLILNPWFFLEATGEIYQGNSQLFTAHTPGDLSYVGRLRGYQDLSESTNIDLGASIAVGRNEIGPDSATRLIGVDATFRYRPLERAIYRRLLARTELVWSRREEDAGSVSAFGFYASGEYQVSRRLFVGARYDFAEQALDATLDDRGGSVLLTFWPSEFNQLRAQYRRIRYGGGPTANELLLQLQFNIGAHGAHVF